MRRYSNFGLSQMLSGLTRAFDLEGNFVSPLDGRNVSPDEVAEEIRGWENVYPIRFRRKNEGFVGPLVLQRRDRSFSLDAAEWYGTRDGSGVAMVGMVERGNGVTRRSAHIPSAVLELVLYDGTREPDRQESLPWLLVSLGLADGIAAPDREGFWHRLPDVSFLEGSIRESGGELPLRRIGFLPEGGDLSAAESEPATPVYRLSRTVKLMFESARWDPRDCCHLIRVTTVTASGSSNGEELTAGELRRRIGKIPGERGRLFWYWFTRQRP